MKKWYVECPFCKNEIKEGAIKCQYCWEFLNPDEAPSKDVPGQTVWQTKAIKKKSKKLLWIWIWVFVLICIIAWKNGKKWTNTTSNSQAPTMAIEQRNESWEVVEVEIEVPKEYLNALKKAQSYSDYQYMSEKSLYKQLTSEYWEWFTKEAADYAINNVKADYNYNALKKWQNYYEHQNMSKQSVYNQLVSEYWEWFTKEQAQYAIDHLDD
jgi:hypothetical protein